MISQIRTLMEFWQISVEDLQKAGVVLPAKPAVAARYKHPITAETWAGEGSQPVRCNE